MSRVIAGRVFVVLLCFLTRPGLAQVNNPYHLNGNAYQEDCNCYTITSAQNNQAGSLWNMNKIDLTNSFDYKFNIFLGCKDDEGADGIVFVLQPISTEIGSLGDGIGFSGISPAVGVVVDTWQNLYHADPTYDHIAIQKNGILEHGSNDLAAPVAASASSNNLEDCEWHTLRVIWDAPAKVLRAQIDGIDRVQTTVDLVADIFGNDPLVFWGFTGATGAANNHQRVCTSLNPAFTLPENQITCFPEPILFIDSSYSFGTIEKWFWDFGDGTSSTLQNPPLHYFPEPGEYEVKLAILGNDGCISDTITRKVVAGSIPSAKFAYNPDLVCEGSPVSFVDESTVEFGTIANWSWMIGSQAFFGEQPPPSMLVGTTDVELRVETEEGCVSDLYQEALVSYPTPSADFNFIGSCAGEPVEFTAVNQNPAIPVATWLWTFGDAQSAMSATGKQSHRYEGPGQFQVQLAAATAIGCVSPPVIKTVPISQTNAYAGEDTVLAKNQPMQLQASGGETYQWTPSTGLSADNIPDPELILQHDARYVLTVNNAAGCPSTDTLNIKVYAGPELYVPSAFTPNNDGKNDLFRIVAAGMRSIDRFQVFNRYGQQVYIATDVRMGWDGRVNGQDQPSGTYVWLIQGTDYTGAAHTKKGTVTLIR